MKALAALLLLSLQGLGLGHAAWQPRVAEVLAGPRSAIIQPAMPSALPVPVQIGDAPLTLGAKSVYAADLATMTPLYAANPNAQLPIASLTKLITVLVILRDHKTTDEVTVGQLPTYESDDQLLGLQTGQRFTVGALLAACLISSDDDAADALGIYDAGSTAKFATKMNRYVQALGLTGMRFDTASGLNDVGNYATARSLAVIAKLTLGSPTVRGLIGQPNTVIQDASGHSYSLTTTNNLLLNGSFSGIKTGFTDAAGQCFIGLTTVDNHQIITVVLGSDNRFGDAQALKNWVAGNWQWQ